MRKPKALLVSAIALVLVICGVGATIAMATPSDSSAAESGTAIIEQKEKRGYEHKNKGVHVDVIGVAGSVLEMTKEDVKAAIKDSKTGDLLIAAGKVEAFKEAYLAELKSKLEAAVTEGTMTQEEADEKYASGKEKMDAYDGTTHLCGGNDHSKMFDKERKKSDKKGSTI